MTVDFLKAFLIGIGASVPLGPAAIFVMQKSILKGRRAGMLTSLGVTAVDTCSAALSLLAVSLIDQYIWAYQRAIFIVGGIIVFAVGVKLFLDNPFARMQCPVRGRASAGDTLQAALCALANPGAFAWMLTMVALSAVGSAGAPLWALVPVVAAGSVCYWLCFTGMFGMLGRKIKPEFLLWLGRIASVAVMAFGAVLVLRGIMMKV